MRLLFLLEKSLHLQLMDNKAPIIGICRHRLATDGEGVTTLVAFHGCPLRCKYCLNPQSLSNPEQHPLYDASSIFEETRIDQLYFIATGGGITFGGGEPCLRNDIITKFRTLCGNEWKLTLETSLNVEPSRFATLLPIIDRLIVDIKDMNPNIYQQYTGCNNKNVIANLKLIIESNRQDDTIIRIPLIPQFNTPTDQEKSQQILTDMGFTKFNLFTYTTKNQK